MKKVGCKFQEKIDTIVDALEKHKLKTLIAIITILTIIKYY
jgi:hypothetical protein